MRKIVTAVTMAAILAATPAMAQSVAPAPAAETQLGSQGENAQFGLGPHGWIIAAVVAGLVIWGIIELVDDDNDEEPVSP